MSLREWITSPCSECKSPVSFLWQFPHPCPVTGWAMSDVYYMRCTNCNQLYVGEYSETQSETRITTGRCWSRSPIDRVHHIEGFIDEAYWRFHEEPSEEICV